MEEPITIEPQGKGIYKIHIDDSTREGKVFLDFARLLAEKEEGIEIIEEEENTDGNS